MSERTEDSGSRDERLDRVIASFLEQSEDGRGQSRDELLARHPDLAEELEGFFDDYDRFGEISEPIESVGPSVLVTAGTRLGDYEILEEIARGGMGVVYRARQVSLRRTVALKMILAGRLASAQEVERLRIEAEAAARLGHPGIVSVYEVGELEGHQYLSMELIEGENLTSHLESFRARPRGAAALLENIALAVQYAHEHGVLHRDLKPANVLLDANGDPHLTDFGLAKLTQDDSKLTLSGAVVGTPTYIAPEILDGSRGSATTASDIYSLGVLLYECLTGGPPFRGSNVLAVLEQVRRDEPKRPRLENPTVDLDLETICLKCLEKEPEGRYRSAGDLADDLHRYLEGKPIDARPTSSFERAVKWARRRPAVAALIVVSVTALLVLLGGGLWYQTRLEQALRSVVERETLNRRYLYSAEMNLAQREWNEGRPDRARAILERQIPEKDQEDLRDFDWYYLWRVSHARRLTLSGHKKRVLSVAIHPGGETIATGSHDTSVRLWSGDGTLRLRLDRHLLPVTALAFSPDGRALATASSESYEERFPELKLWDVASGRQRLELEGHAAGIQALAYTPDGQSLISGSSDGQVILWNSLSGEVVLRISTEAAIASMALSPRGDQLAVANNSAHLGQVSVWNPRSGEIVQRLSGHEGSVRAVTFLADGALLATGGDDGTIRVWDARSGKPRSRFSVSRMAVFSLTSSRDGRYLACVTSSDVHQAQSELTLWTATDAGDLKSTSGSPIMRGAIKIAEFSPHGAQLVAARAHAAEVWDVDLLATPKRLPTEGTPAALDFSPDGEILAAVDADGVLTVWDTETWGEPARVETDRRSLLTVALSPDGRLLATGSQDRAVDLWEVEAGQTPRHLRAWTGHRGGIRSLTFDPSGMALAAGSFGTVTVWSARSGERLARFPAHSGRVSGVRFSPGGESMITGGLDGAVKRWNTERWNVETVLANSGPGVLALAITPDGTLVAAGREDHSVRLWELSSGKLRATFAGHSHSIGSVVFSPGGESLLTAGRGSVIKLWDVATGRERMALSETSAVLRYVAMSPDAQWLAAAGSPGAVFLWRAAGAAESAAYRLRPGSPMTAVTTSETIESDDWTDVTPTVLRGSGGCQGIALGDVDADGDLDVYLSYNGPNRLLRNDGRGVFTDITPALLADEEDSFGAAFADYDQDGDLDLSLANAHAPDRLFRAEGPGSFVDVADGPTADPGNNRGVAWIDVDGDGDLDLYKSRAKSTDRILINDGRGLFSEAKPEGLPEGRGATWCDFDDDGDPDVFLANSKGSWISRNLGGGRFLVEEQLSFRTPGRRAAFGDYDGDGLIDLYVSTGRRFDTLFRQADGQFVPAALEFIPSKESRWVDFDLDGNLDLFLASDRGSHLLQSDGSGGFTDVTRGALKDLGGIFCAVWFDFDRDGDPDLLAADWNKSNRLVRNDQATGHHWLQVELVGVHSNRTGVGARVKVRTDGKTQIRDITAASRQSAPVACFGLGQTDVIDRLEVRWPSGIVQQLEEVLVDQRLRVVEELRE